MMSKTLKLSKIFLIVLLLFLVTIKSLMAYDLSDPWEKQQIIKSRDEESDSFAKQIFHKIIRFYQKYISPLDGPRCSMYPTCSAYSIEANQKHGAVLGFIMTADRLIHESEERKFVPIIKVYGNDRFYDPVSNNDFWFENKKGEK